MKKSLNIKTVWLLIILAALSCDDQLVLTDEGVNQLYPATPEVYNRWDDSGKIAPLYDGSDSGPIAMTIADSWIQNFNKTASRNASVTQFYTREAIEGILAQKGCTGIRIYYAINEAGEKKLIISGVNSFGQNIFNENSLLTMAGNSFKRTGNTINYDVAKLWIKNYEITIGPTEIRSHYFGQNAIRKVLNQKNCIGLHIYQAMNDKRDRKLLVTGVSSTVSSFDGGVLDIKNHEFTLPVIVDFSFPCPSTCGVGG